MPPPLIFENLRKDKYRTLRKASWLKLSILPKVSKTTGPAKTGSNLPKVLPACPAPFGRVESWHLRKASWLKFSILPKVSKTTGPAKTGSNLPKVLLACPAPFGRLLGSNSASFRRFLRRLVLRKPDQTFRRFFPHAPHPSEGFLAQA